MDKSVKSFFIIFIFSLNRLQAQKTEAQLLQYLQTYRGGISQNVYPCSFIPGVNVTDTVIKRILSLLRNEWSDEEIALTMKQKFDEDFQYLYFYKILDKSILLSKVLYGERIGLIIYNSKRDTSSTLSKQYHSIYDSVFKSVYDSTLKVYKKQIEQKIKEKPVSNELIKLAALIGLKEAIPLFKNDLNAKSKHLYNPEIAELALAKLGDKVLYKKILKECSYNSDLNDYDSVRYQDNQAWTNDFYYKFDKLTFLNTQESLFQLHHWLDTSKFCIYSQVNADIILGYSSFIVGYRLLQHFRRGDEIKKYRAKDLGISKFAADAILDVKKWMIENKGKYVIKHECPE